MKNTIVILTAIRAVDLLVNDKSAALALKINLGHSVQK